MVRTRKINFRLTEEEKESLSRISSSKSEQIRRIQRARILLSLAEGHTNKAVAEKLGVSVLTVRKVLDKYHSAGIEGALEDYQRSGRPLSIDAEAKVWVTSLACRLPKDLPNGPPLALWSMGTLTQYVRDNCESNGFACLKNVSKSQVWGFLQQHELRPQKIKYFLEKKNPDFQEKTKKVLLVYKRIDWILKSLDKELSFIVDSPELFLNEAYVLHDEKPEIHADSSVAPNLSPNKNCGLDKRHCERRRLGTVSLLAGINLVDVKIIGIVREGHGSDEFVEFLQMVDKNYDSVATIHIILGNHSDYRSKKVFEYLSTIPNRFKFTFVPKYTSWLNLIEGFFSKSIRVKFRGLRVKTKAELIQHIEEFIEQMNEVHVVYRWKGQLEDIEQAFQS